MTNTNIPVININKVSLEEFAGDPARKAKLYNLVYVAGNEKGISRKKWGEKFRYYVIDKLIKEPDVLERLKKLAIPPAWTDVWICKKANGHLQATGFDIRGRKQYRYHTLWNKLRSETKYFRLYDFGKNLPTLREQLEKDMAVPGLHMEKILATIVLLLEQTSIRIGSSFYEKLYGSYGLTTLKNKHVSIKGTNILFSFKGKKGIDHEISLRSKRLANIVKKCHAIPGKELFQFYDEQGKIHPVDSGMVNEYIQQISGAEFSAKDFRTWAGSVHALSACHARGVCEDSNLKTTVNEVLKEVALQLGNTPTVCKKYYVHPLVLELYQSRELYKFTKELNNSNQSLNDSRYTPHEKVLMKILKSDLKTTKTIEII